MTKSVHEKRGSERILEKALTVWERDNAAVLGATREPGGYRKIVRVRISGRSRSKTQGEDARH